MKKLNEWLLNNSESISEEDMIKISQDIATGMTQVLCDKIPNDLTAKDAVNITSLAIANILTNLSFYYAQFFEKEKFPEFYLDSIVELTKKCFKKV